MAKLNHSDFTGGKFNQAVFRVSSNVETNYTNALMTQSDFRSADFSSAILPDSKLEGTLFNKRSMLPISVDQALKLGMVEKSGVTLILWDKKDEDFYKFVTSLEAAGQVIELAPVVEYAYDVTTIPDQFDTVLHLNGSQPAQSFSINTQKALVQFVNSGGKYLYGEWNGYEYAQGRMSEMSDLIIIRRKFPASMVSGMTLKETIFGKKHPLLANLKFPLYLPMMGMSLGEAAVFSKNPVQVLAKSVEIYDEIAIRRLGEGLVIAFAFETTGPYAANALNNPNILQLYLNALEFER